MAVPTIRAVGTIASGTGTISPGLPAGTVAGDLLVMFCETQGSEAVTVSGWTQAPNSPQDAGASTTRLTVFYKIAVGSDATLTNDPGDHISARIIGITAGTFDTTTPFNVTAGNTDTSNTTSISIPGATTTVADCLVLAACSVGTDPGSDSTTNFTGWANAALGSVTERMDNLAAAGLGGGFGVASGTKVTAGAYGTTTATCGTAAFQGRWSGAIQPPQSQALTLTVADRVSLTAYFPAVMADSPKAYYRMNEASGLIQDSSGNGNHATVQGSATYVQAGLVPDDPDTAISFDGTNDYFEIPDNATLDFGDVLSIELWFKPTVTGIWQVLISKGAGGYGVDFVTNSNWNLFKQGTGDVAFCGSSGAGQTYHMVFTKNGASRHIYMNGVDVTALGTNATIVDTTGALSIGRTLGASDYINGVLDEVALYNTELSAAQVLAHYNAAFPQLTLTIGVTVDLTDTISLADQLDLSLGWDLSPTDTMALADLYDSPLGLNLPQADAITFADQFDSQLDQNLGLADPLTLVDLYDAPLVIVTDLVDAATLADLYDYVFGTQLDLVDTVAMVDALSTDSPTDISPADTISMLDDLTWTATYDITFPETVALVDAYTYAFEVGVVPTDTMALVDLFDGVTGSNLDLVDVMGTVDDFVPSQNFPVDLADANTLTDSLTLFFTTVAVTGSPKLTLKGKAYVLPTPTYSHTGKPKLTLKARSFVLRLSVTPIVGKPKLILQGKRATGEQPGLTISYPQDEDLVPTIIGSGNLVPSVPQSRNLVPTVEEFR